MGSLMFVDDVTADRIGKMNSKMYVVILMADIEPNATKLVRRRFTVRTDG